MPWGVMMAACVSSYQTYGDTKFEFEKYKMAFNVPQPKAATKCQCCGSHTWVAKGVMRICAYCRNEESH